MNAHNLNHIDRTGPISPLKAWRLRQLVEDEDKPKVRRTMRITDVPRLHPGIAITTWHQWEQLPGSEGFKRPNDDNMRRICVEITKGELSPDDFYPVDDWQAELASGG